MFDKDFYPTPTETIELMGIDCHDKVVLEPSAGSGNIIDWLKDNGAKEVLSCELNDKLSLIAKSKSRFLCKDFLSLEAERVSHVQMIIGNPPFSSGARHVLHAWNIAPGGCEIIMLVNAETIENDYSQERRELKRIIDDYGNTVDLGATFTTAERKTDVEVSVIKLYKPQSEGQEFEGFFMYEDPEQQGTGIMEYNVVREIVQRYVNCVKKFGQIMSLAFEMQELAGPLSSGSIVCNMGYKNEVVSKEDYKKELQKTAWKYLFDKMSLDKYVTSGVMKDINKFVESQEKVPFTMKNIYRMFEIIVGTREQSFNRSLVEAVDKFTEHTHENRYSVEGWKTNAGHLLNEKFIIPYIFKTDYGHLQCVYGYRGCYSESIEDLVKVICSTEGVNYDDYPRLARLCMDVKLQPGEWHDWTFFQIKGFKKGTMHVKFKSRDVWSRLNQRYAKIKGQVLPENI